MPSQQQAYSWTSNWICPQCSHEHSKPHFAFKDQVDLSLQPQEVGRVKYDREEKYDRCKEPTGEAEIKGKQQPLFCPHCGWLDDLLYIEKINSKQKKSSGKSS